MDRIKVIPGDITQFAVDALVNASNTRLSDGARQQRLPQKLFKIS